MNDQVPAIAKERLPYHPAAAERYGIDRSAWRALVEAVFPTAKTPEGVILALSYCKARNLDVFKRPVHVVPIWNKDLNRYVETVWPGIGELRTTAFRTGHYIGCDSAEFGPDTTATFTSDKANVSVTFPEWCQITVHRMVRGKERCWPGPKVYWLETYSRIGRSDMPNEMWQKRPRGQLEKCAEAAALRKAFPEEIGEQHIPEEAPEMVDVTPAPEKRARPAQPTSAPTYHDVFDLHGETFSLTDAELPGWIRSHLEPQLRGANADDLDALHEDESNHPLVRDAVMAEMERRTGGERAQMPRQSEQEPRQQAAAPRPASRGQEQSSPAGDATTGQQTASRRGRPPGSKNRPKVAEPAQAAPSPNAPEPTFAHAREIGPSPNRGNLDDWPGDSSPPGHLQSDSNLGKNEPTGHSLGAPAGSSPRPAPQPPSDFDERGGDPIPTVAMGRPPEVAGETYDPLPEGGDELPPDLQEPDEEVVGPGAQREQTWSLLDQNLKRRDFTIAGLRATLSEGPPFVRQLIIKNNAGALAEIGAQHPDIAALVEKAR